MKNLLGTVMVLVLMAVATGFFCYRLNSEPALPAIRRDQEAA